MRGLIFEIGFDIKLIKFSQPKRIYGKTKNNFFTLLDFGILGLVKHTKLSRFLTIFGFILSFLSLSVSIVFFHSKDIFLELFLTRYCPNNYWCIFLFIYTNFVSRNNWGIC